jgi:cytoskeletal protein RodZ
MKKTIYIVIAIVLIGGGVWFWKFRTPAKAPTTADNSNSSVNSDNAASMSADLNNINVQDADFQSIDTDTNSL